MEFSKKLSGAQICVTSMPVVVKDVTPKWWVGRKGNTGRDHFIGEKNYKSMLL
jgi:hypothetical protein